MSSFDESGLVTKGHCVMAFRREQLRLAAGVLLLIAATMVIVPMLDSTRGKTVELGDKCDADCQQKKEMVAEQMKKLRAQISSDYKSMVTFGDDAGYVPPVRSIKAQLMDGSLLGGTDSGPAAPPPFDPNLAVSGRASRGRHHAVGGPSGKFDNDAEKRLLASEEPASTRDESDSSILPPVKTLQQTEASLMKTTPASTGDDSDSLDSDIMNPPHIRSSSSSNGSSGSGGSGAWAKAFSFMGNHAGLSHPHHHESSHRSAPHESSVVRRAMHKALSIESGESRSEEAGDKLLGLGRGAARGRGARKDPLHSRFLNDIFGRSS